MPPFQKIRLYGVIEAFRQGRMPSNSQIDETLKYIIDNSPVETSKLSAEGMKLVQDTRDIIETARVIVAEKNADELFQNFVWHTRDVELGKVLTKEPGDAAAAAAEEVDREKVKDDGQQGVYH
jgi:Family of unknown function (DUF5923)